MTSGIPAHVRDNAAGGVRRNTPHHRNERTANMPGTVISLFDHSGIACQPWARIGYECYCFDVQHPLAPRCETIGNGRIWYVHANLNHDAWGWSLVQRIIDLFATGKRFMFAWPPCEDMTVSGNRHKARKRAADPLFQWKAARRATRSAALARKNGFAAMVENPIGALCTLWRKPDVIWHPWHFGGLLPDDDKHPTWPKYIAPRDAYTKGTGAWLVGDFRWPAKRSVTPEILERKTKSGRTIRGSRQFMYLGGASPKTKEIRNLSPRGAALAFALENA